LVLLPLGALHTRASDANRLTLRLRRPNGFIERDCPGLPRCRRSWRDLRSHSWRNDHQGGEDRSYSSGRNAATILILS
jgi:hypothetical protein